MPTDMQSVPSAENYLVNSRVEYYNLAKTISIETLAGSAVPFLVSTFSSAESEKFEIQNEIYGLVFKTQYGILQVLFLILSFL